MSACGSSGRSREEADPVRSYEIGLDGDVVELARGLAPDADVRATRQVTQLWRRPCRPGELDLLLQELFGLGITPRELFESPDYCEVRIDGSYGAAVLRHLGWCHRLAQTTVVRGRLTPEALRRLSGISRLDYLVSG